MKTRLFILMSMIFTLASCSSFDNETVSFPVAEPGVEAIDVLPSPYSIDVMEQAYEYVKSNSTRNTNIDVDNVVPTHRYVKFTPVNRHQVDALINNYTVYNFPLDAIPQAKANEAVSAINNGDLYALVEYDAILPDSITHDEICTLHNPYAADNIDIDSDVADEITKTAYAISKYGDASMASVLTPWRPKGTIRVWDDLTNDYIPLEGVEVHITNSLLSSPWIVRTDENGYFEGNLAFSDDISYIIQWKGDEWAIKFDDMNPAMTVSYSSRLPLDLVIPKSSVATYNAATVNRAAYYYWNIALQFTPPTMSETVRITCYNEPNNGDGSIGLFYPGDRGIDKPIIEIWCGNRLSQDIISTTFHELAHAVHYTSAGAYNYNQTNRIIKESWTRYIQSKLPDYLYSGLSSVTNVDYEPLMHNQILYLDYGYQSFVEYSPDNYNRQNWVYNPNSSQFVYTPLFIDITDCLNQREWYQSFGINSNNYPNDKVYVMGGISLIEHLVFHCKTVAEVKSALLEYISEQNLDIQIEDVNDLFEIYERVEAQINSSTNNN